MKAALLYLILLAGLGASLFFFFTSRESGNEDLTLISLAGAAVSFVLLVLLFLVRKLGSRRKKNDVEMRKA